MFYDLILKEQKTKPGFFTFLTFDPQKCTRQVKSACSDLKQYNIHNEEFNGCSNVCLKLSHVSGNVWTPACS